MKNSRQYLPKLATILVLAAFLPTAAHAQLAMTDAIFTAPVDNQRGLATFEMDNGGLVYEPVAIATFDQTTSGGGSMLVNTGNGGWNLSPNTTGQPGNQTVSVTDAYITTNAFGLQNDNIFSLNTTVNDGDGQVFYLTEHNGNDDNIVITPYDAAGPIGTWSLTLNASDYAPITTLAEYNYNNEAMGTIAGTVFTLADFTGGTGTLTGVTRLEVDGDGRLDPSQIGVAFSESAPLLSYHSWLQGHSLPPDGSGLGAPDASPAGDQIGNFLKFALGLNPHESGYGQRFRWDVERHDGLGHLILSWYSPDPPPGGVVLEVEHSTELANPASWTADGWIVLADEMIKGLRYRRVACMIGEGSGAGAHFFRLAATETEGPINRAAPEISGIPAIETPLTANPGTWISEDEATFTYQWRRDGEALEGATGSSYTIDPADLGHRISVDVTAQSTAGVTTVRSEAMGPVGEKPPGLLLTVEDFSRDYALFDGDVMRGNNRADIGLSGTTDAPDGTVIEARAVSVDDEGATTTAWRPIGVVSGGEWSGTMETPLSTSWYRAEVRFEDSDVLVARTDHRFGVGLVIYHHRQSNGDRVYNASGSAPVPDLGGIGNDFQVWRLINRGDPDDPDINATVQGPLFVTQGSTPTRALAAMAEIFLRNAPGLKVAILADIKSGRSTYDTLRDSGRLAETRLFSKTQALFEAYAADGQEVGAYIVDHWNGYSSVASLEQQHFGGPGGDPGIPMAFDHSFHEVMPGLLTGRTQMLFAGIGMFYPSNTYPGSGGSADNTRRITAEFVAKYPDRAKTLLDHELATRYDNADRGTVHNGNHYDTHTIYGAPFYAAGRAVGVLQAAGILSFEQPRMDQVAWADDGSYVDIWSSHGPITTIERQEALREGRAPENYPVNPSRDPAFADPAEGQREVLGVQFADFFMPRRIEIVDEFGNPAAAGRLRVYPDSGSFNVASALYYGQGHIGVYFEGIGGSSGADYARDALTARHLPIIDVGVEGRLMEYGVYVAPQMDRNWITQANDIESDATTFTQIGPYDPISLGFPGTQAVTIHAKMAIQNNAFRVVASSVNDTFFSIILSPDSITMAARNHAAETVFDVRNESDEKIPADHNGSMEMLIRLDTPAERIEVYYKDAEGDFVPFDPENKFFDHTSFREVSHNLRGETWEVLGLNSGSNLIEFVRFWKVGGTGATLPDGTPWRAIEADTDGSFTSKDGGQFNILEDGVPR